MTKPGEPGDRNRAAYDAAWRKFAKSLIDKPKLSGGLVTRTAFETGWHEAIMWAARTDFGHEDYVAADGSSSSALPLQGGEGSSPCISEGD